MQGSANVFGALSGLKMVADIIIGFKSFLLQRNVVNINIPQRRAVNWHRLMNGNENDTVDMNLNYSDADAPPPYIQ